MVAFRSAANGKDYSRAEVKNLLMENRGTFGLDEFRNEIVRGSGGMDISVQHLSNYLQGHRPEPPKTVLAYLGLEKVVVYRRKQRKGAVPR